MTHELGGRNERGHKMEQIFFLLSSKRCIYLVLQRRERFETDIKPWIIIHLSLCKTVGIIWQGGHRKNVIYTSLSLSLPERNDGRVDRIPLKKEQKKPEIVSVAGERQLTLFSARKIEAYSAQCTNGRPLRTTKVHHGLQTGKK